MPPPIRPGSRLFVTGQTGSGKTRGMIYHAVRQPLPIIILDTKIEPAFTEIPGAVVVDGLNIDALYAHYDEHPDAPPFIVRPGPDEYDPELLDAYVGELYRVCDNACIVLDELYSFMRSGVAGPGLTGLLTRGRSKGLSAIMGAQRPRRVSLFCLSETDYYAVYLLRLAEDRARIAEAAGYSELLEPPPGFCYWWADREGCRLERPVPIRIVAQPQPPSVPLDKPRLNLV